MRPLTQRWHFLVRGQNVTFQAYSRSGGCRVREAAVQSNTRGALSMLVVATTVAITQAHDQRPASAATPNSVGQPSEQTSFAAFAARVRERQESFGPVLEGGAVAQLE